MMKKILSKALCTVFILSILFTFSACGNSETLQATDLTRDIQISPVEVPIDAPSGTSSDADESEDNPLVENTSEPNTLLAGTEQIAVSDFSVRLFQQSIASERNTLISPTSVLYALAMTANGAKEDTLVQMEEVFGLPIDSLNSYLSSYINNLPIDDKYKLHIANAIWFKENDSFTVKQDFLQTNEKYYNAGLYQAPFDDSTLKEINTWVNENTDGMISNILDKIPADAVMYLVNALSFDAEWQEIYETYQVRDGIFKKEDGSTQDIQLMYSSEHDYLEDESATGFIKYYKDRKYAFVALLPKEGVSVTDYISTLTGEHLYEMLTTPENVHVNAAIPKFKTEFSAEMSEPLKSLGMTDAFDWNAADFSGIGTSQNGNLVISRILHKTFISVDEKGTEAGAATVVEIRDEAAMVEPEESKTVYLDRPFVYMLIDCEKNLPLFMGTVMNINE